MRLPQPEEGQRLSDAALARRAPSLRGLSVWRVAGRSPGNPHDTAFGPDQTGVWLILRDPPAHRPGWPPLRSIGPHLAAFSQRFRSQHRNEEHALALLARFWPGLCGAAPPRHGAPAMAPLAHCPIHGVRGHAVVCAHVAAAHAAGQPVRETLGLVLACDGCFAAEGLAAFQEMIDGSSWTPAAQAAYDRIDAHADFLCWECAQVYRRP